MDPSQLEALLSQYTPEQLAQLLGMGTLDERGSALQKQQEQADALAGGSSAQRYSTGAGAAIGGVGNAIASVGGGVQGLMLGKQQAQLLDKKDAGRLEYLRGLRAKPPGPPAGAVPGSAGAGDIPLDGLFRYG